MPASSFGCPVLPRVHAMKLEPVFLVAPKVSAGSVPTRRAFIFAGAAFLGGAVFGTACGYSLGAAAGPTPSPSEPAAPASTGDAKLDELRRLAVTAPIEELVAEHLDFVWWRERHYPNDAVLWQGVSRLAREVLR